MIDTERKEIALAKLDEFEYLVESIIKSEEIYVKNGASNTELLKYQNVQYLIDKIADFLIPDSEEEEI